MSQPEGPTTDARTISRATQVLAYERLVAAFWPMASVVAGFLGLTFLGLFEGLNATPHSVLLLAFAAGLIWTGRRGYLAFHRVTRQDALQKIERDNGLDHRPLESLEDPLALGHDDPLSKALWDAHQARLKKALGPLRVATPQSQIVSLDPWALRFPPVALLVLGLVLGWGHLSDRTIAMLTPSLPGPEALVWKAEFWITPPVYTGESPRYLTTDEETLPEPMVVPEGSLILVQTVGLPGQVALIQGEQILPLQSLGGSDARQLESVIIPGQGLGLAHDGQLVFQRPMMVKIDEPPDPEFAQTPASASGARLRVDYLATDDYGVTEMQAKITRQSVTDGSEMYLDLPLARVGTKAVQGRAFFDLAAHPWAGLPVSISLTAKDSRNQMVESDPIAILMPERIFNHPIARLLADSRKRLATPSPDIIYDVADTLEQALVHPKQFFDDLVVFMGLKFSVNRLRSERALSDMPKLRQLFWDLALRIEDGEMVLAERDLQDAQDRLMEAMNNGASPEEIANLMREVEQAMSDYLSALAQELEDRGMDPEAPLPDGQSVASDEIMQMMERARQMAEAGDMDGARELMNSLREMLDGIQNAMRDGQTTDPFMSQAREIMDDLRGLSEDQRQLMDDTYQDMQEEDRRREEEILGRQFPGFDPQQDNQAQGQQQNQNQQPGEGPLGQNDAEASEQGEQANQPGQGEGEGEGLAGSSEQRQNALRQGLGDVMRQMDEMLGSIPQDVGAAERAMRRAEDALGRGDAGAAIGPQGEALEHMRQATEGLSEQMARRAQAQGGMQMGRRQGNQGRDPFGRHQNGPGQGQGATGSVTLPDQGEVQRAQEILRELRRRSGEQNRPRIERDYIDRLLRRF